MFYQSIIIVKEYFINSTQISKYFDLLVSHLVVGDVILENLQPLQEHFPYPGDLVKMPQQCSQAKKITVNKQNEHFKMITMSTV